MKKITLTAVIIFLFLLSYRKEKNTVTTHDIKGMVFNNCTDSGLANVTVYLSDAQGLNTSTQSDVNGNFNFSNTKIHSSNKYKYAINIPSKSGDAATTFEHCGFNGDAIGFVSSNAT